MLMSIVCLFLGVFLGVLIMSLMIVSSERPLSNIGLDSTGVAAVDEAYFWRPMATCPLNAKVQLLGDGGVAVYGTFNGKDTFWNAWAPVPKKMK